MRARVSKAAELILSDPDLAESMFEVTREGDSNDVDVEEIIKRAKARVGKNKARESEIAKLEVRINRALGV